MMENAHPLRTKGCFEETMADVNITNAGGNAAYSLNPGTSVEMNLGNFQVTLEDAVEPSDTELNPNMPYDYEVLFLNRVDAAPAVIPVTGVANGICFRLEVPDSSLQHRAALAGPADDVTLRVDRLTDSPVSGKRFLLTFSV
jgi:hypothetical protein